MNNDERPGDPPDEPPEHVDERPPSHVEALPIPEFITIECRQCHGTGRWTPPQNPMDYLAGKMVKPETCPNCGGKGQVQTIRLPG